MKANGYPDRRTPRPPTAAHAPSGQFSLCGAYFAPIPAEDGTLPIVTCKRCIRTMERLVQKMQLRPVGAHVL